jgi:Cyclin
LSLIYIDRLIQRNSFVLTELNVHRVVITSILLAAKFFDDVYYNNAYYAKVGGVLVSEMNGLEVDFLFRVNFSLHFTPDEFEQYRRELLAHARQQQPQQQHDQYETAPAQVSPELHGIPAGSSPFHDELACVPSSSVHHHDDHNNNNKDAATTEDGGNCMVVEDEVEEEEDEEEEEEDCFYDDENDDDLRWHSYNVEPNPVAVLATTVDPIFGRLVPPQYGMMMMKDYTTSGTGGSNSGMCLSQSPSTFEQRPRLTGRLGVGL